MRRSRFIAIAALLTLFVTPLLATLFTGSSAYAFAPDTDLSTADASFWGEDAGDRCLYSGGLGLIGRPCLRGAKTYQGLYFQSLE